MGVLVGFLGSGKTTTLNHLLKGVHGKKIAVVVNEFGAVDVDSTLVAREVTADAELISLSNACICCKLRGDLLRAVHDLTERFDLDYILVESTGLGEAAPIAQTFFAPDLQGRVRLDAVIDVVDAAHFWDTYEDAGAEGQIAGDERPRGLAELLAGQIEFADVVLLNKTDLAGPEATARLEAFVRELNPRARIQRTRFGDADPETLLYTGAFDLDAVEDTEEWQEAEEELEHDVLGAAGEHDEPRRDDEDEHGDARRRGRARRGRRARGARARGRQLRLRLLRLRDARPARPEPPAAPRLRPLGGGHHRDRPQQGHRPAGRERPGRAVEPGRRALRPGAPRPVGPRLHPPDAARLHRARGGRQRHRRRPGRLRRGGAAEGATPRPAPSP